MPAVCSLTLLYCYILVPSRRTATRLARRSSSMRCLRRSGLLFSTSPTLSQFFCPVLWTVRTVRVAPRRRISMFFIPGVFLRAAARRGEEPRGNDLDLRSPPVPFFFMTLSCRPAGTSLALKESAGCLEVTFNRGLCAMPGAL